MHILIDRLSVSIEQYNRVSVKLIKRLQKMERVSRPDSPNARIEDLRNILLTSLKGQLELFHHAIHEMDSKVVLQIREPTGSLQETWEVLQELRGIGVAVLKERCISNESQVFRTLEKLSQDTETSSLVLERLLKVSPPPPRASLVAKESPPKSDLTKKTPVDTKTQRLSVEMEALSEMLFTSHWRLGILQDQMGETRMHLCSF